MAFTIRKAERRRARLRLGMAGASGSGKTASALLLAYGITRDWAKIGFIDTENGSGELYVGQTIGGTRIGDYLYGRLEAPFTVQKYLDALTALTEAGVDLIIIDSLSHAWAGEGGLLDKQGKLADRTGNSYTAWRNVTPEHNALVEAMLQSPCHIIATVRAKTEYVQEKDGNGKTVVRKVGMAPIFRDGVEYEFSVFLDIAADHTAQASKDRTTLFDGQIAKIAPKHGDLLREWLESGTSEPPAPQPAPQPAAKAEPTPNQGIVDKTRATLDERVISDAQRKRMWAMAQEHGYGEAGLRAILGEHGYESAKAIRTTDYEAICDELSKPKEAAPVA